MYRQDYIMRLVSEMTRVILKWLFNIEDADFTDEIYKQNEIRQILELLFRLSDGGNLSEAISRVREMVEYGDKESLKVALLFYHRINDEDDSYLVERGVDRETIRDEVGAVVSAYGLEGIVEVLMQR